MLRSDHTLEGIHSSVSPPLSKPGRSQGLSWYGECLLIPATLAAVAIFVVVGAGRSIWLDEANCIRIASQNLPGMVENLRHDNNLPAYYFLLSAWIRVFGDSEIALRALSAIFYLAGGGVAFALGQRVCLTRRGACYSAFFYLCSALSIRQAQNIRMYALLGMLAGLSSLAFIWLFFDEDQSWQTKTLFLAVNALGILTHVWFVFVLLAQLAAVLVFKRRRLLAWVAGAAIAALPFLGLWSLPFLDQLRNGATAWMTVFPARLLVYAPLEFYDFPLVLVLYGTAGCAWVLAGAQKREQLLKERMIPLVFLLFAVSLGCPLLISLVRPIYFPGRYAVIALAPLAALLAGVLSACLPRIVLSLLCFLLLAPAVANQIAHRNEVRESLLPTGQSDRTTAQFLLQHAAPGDAVVFTSLTRPAADYYFHRAEAGHRFIEINFPAETAAHPGWIDLSVSPERQAALESEAAATTRKLQQITASGGKIWLYYGGSVVVSDFLKRQLDSTLPQPRDYPLAGVYHRHILEYAARPE